MTRKSISRTVTIFGAVLVACGSRSAQERFDEAPSGLGERPPIPACKLAPNGGILAPQEGWDAIFPAITKWISDRCSATRPGSFSCWYRLPFDYAPDGFEFTFDGSKVVTTLSSESIEFYGEEGR